MKKASKKPQKTSIAKISRPHINDALTRERLYTLLDAGLNKPLLWIAGPGGSGKSTLVSGWLEERALPCLWYQVDEADADPATFIYYLGLAAQQVTPRKKRRLPLLTPEYAAGMPAFARRFFEELFSRLSPPFTLVLDNYQEIPSNSPVHELLLKGVEVMPAGITMIVISRTDPSAQYARMRAAQQVSYVGWNDLRFCRHEIEVLISTMRFAERPGQWCVTTDLLYERTDGWAAGIVLLLEALRRLPEDTDMPSLLHRSPASSEQQYQAIFDYFASELFSKTDGDICDFLLRSAFLPLMTEKTARALTASDHAGRILRDLSVNHCFTDWRSAPEPVYQYHPLFREFLLKTAVERFGATEIGAMRLRAAALLDEAGYVDNAVELLGEAGAVEELTRIIRRDEAALFAQGRYGTLIKWLGQLPKNYLRSDPHLLRIAGLCSLPYSPAEARSYLEQSCELLEESGDVAAELVVYGCLMEVVVIEGEAFSTIDRYLERAHELAGHDAVTAAIAGKIAGTALFALVFRCPDHRTLPFWLSHVEAALMRDNDVATDLKLCNYLMAYYLIAGEFNRMTRAMETLGSRRKEVEQIPALRLLCLLLEAYHTANVRTDLEAGRALALQGLALARESGVVVYNFWFSYLATACSVWLGDLQRAEEVLDGMLPAGRPVSLIRTADVSMLRGGLAFCKGYQAEALEYFMAARSAFNRVGSPMSEALSLINVANVLVKLDRVPEARSYLVQAEQFNWGGSWISAFRGLLSMARACFAAGDDEAGLTTLRSGLAVGREHGIHLPAFWQVQEMAELCARALEAGIETGFVIEHIRRHNLAPDPSRPVEAWPYPVQIRTFGDFEIIKDGEPLLFSGKVQKKPLELLKAIIALGGRDVLQEELCDLLWSDADGDTAANSFKFTLHQLRKLLGSDACIQLKGGSVSLSSRCCHTDAAAFQQIVNRMRQLLEKPAAGTGEQIALLAEKASALYQGEFLRHDRRYPWVAVAGERYKGGFIRLLGAACDRYEETEQWEKAARICERALDADDLDEGFHHRQIRCLLRLGYPSRALVAYNRCCSVLSTRLGISPSLHTKALLAGILPDR